MEKFANSYFQDLIISHVYGKHTYQPNFALLNDGIRT